MRRLMSVTNSDFTDLWHGSIKVKYSAYLKHIDIFSTVQLSTYKQ